MNSLRKTMIFSVTLAVVFNQTPALWAQSREAPVEKIPTIFTDGLALPTGGNIFSVSQAGQNGELRGAFLPRTTKLEANPRVNVLKAWRASERRLGLPSGANVHPELFRAARALLPVSASRSVPGRGAISSLSGRWPTRLFPSSAGGKAISSWGIPIVGSLDRKADLIYRALKNGVGQASSELWALYAKTSPRANSESFSPPPSSGAGSSARDSGSAGGAGGGGSGGGDEPSGRFPGPTKYFTAAEAAASKAVAGEKIDWIAASANFVDGTDAWDYVFYAPSAKKGIIVAVFTDGTVLNPVVIDPRQEFPKPISPQEVKISLADAVKIAGKEGRFTPREVVVMRNEAGQAEYLLVGGNGEQVSINAGSGAVISRNAPASPSSAENSDAPAQTLAHPAGSVIPEWWTPRTKLQVGKGVQLPTGEIAITLTAFGETDDEVYSIALTKPAGVRGVIKAHFERFHSVSQESADHEITTANVREFIQLLKEVQSRPEYEQLQPGSKEAVEAFLSELNARLVNHGPLPPVPGKPRPQSSGLPWSPIQLEAFLNVGADRAIRSVYGVKDVKVDVLKGTDFVSLIIIVDDSQTIQQFREAIESAAPGIRELYGVLGAPNQVSYQYLNMFSLQAVNSSADAASVAPQLKFNNTVKHDDKLLLTNALTSENGQVTLANFLRDEFLIAADQLPNHQLLVTAAETRSGKYAPSVRGVLYDITVYPTSQDTGLAVGRFKVALDISGGELRRANMVRVPENPRDLEDLGVGEKQVQLEQAIAKRGVKAVTTMWRKGASYRFVVELTSQADFRKIEDIFQNIESQRTYSGILVDVRANEDSTALSGDHTAQTRAPTAAEPSVSGISNDFKKRLDLVRLWTLSVGVDENLLNDERLQKEIENEDGFAAADRLLELAYKSHHHKSIEVLRNDRYRMELVGVITGNPGIFQFLKEH